MHQEGRRFPSDDPDRRPTWMRACDGSGIAAGSVGSRAERRVRRILCLCQHRSSIGLQSGSQAGPTAQAPSALLGAIIWEKEADS